MNSILQAILELVDQGLSHQEIADKLQITVGKVRYQLYKKKQPDIEAEFKTGSVQIEDAEVDPWYGEDQLVLLPLNPTSIYAYWEISEDRKRLIEQHFECAWGTLPKILRVFDVTDLYFNGDNAHYYTDVAVHDMSNNWFVHHLNPKRNYCLDLGVLTWDGRFFTILRSNIIHLPPSHIQPWKEHDMWTKPTEKNEPLWLQEFTGYTLYKREDRR